MDSNLTTQKVNRDTTKTQNLHGRRITGASPSQGPSDYVTKQELDSAIASGSSLNNANLTTFSISSLIQQAIAIFQQTLPSSYYKGITTQAAVSSPATNTPYHASGTGPPVTILVSINVAASGVVNILCDLSNPPTTVILTNTNTSLTLAQTFNFTFTVIPNWWFEIAIGVGTIVNSLVIIQQY